MVTISIAYGTSAELAIHESNSRNRIVIVTVGVLVTSFNKFLLSFSQAEWTNKTLPISAYIDIGHITWVIDTWLPLKMIYSLILMASFIHMCVLK